jgi:hypothetical protein
MLESEQSPAIPHPTNQLYEQIVKWLADFIQSPLPYPEAPDPESDSDTAATTSSSASTSSSISTASGTSLSDNFEFDDQFRLTTNILVLQHWQQRYLVERTSMPKSIHFYMQILSVPPLSRCVGLFRMSPEMLGSIVGTIENHAVFNNLSVKDQARIPLQVAGTIRRLCCESSSGSGVTSTAQLFGISESTVLVFTKRTIYQSTDRYHLGADSEVAEQD